MGNNSPTNPAYEDLPMVGDVYRKQPARSNPDPTGTAEYKAQRARFDARQQGAAPQPEANAAARGVQAIQKQEEDYQNLLDEQQEYTNR